MKKLKPLNLTKSMPWLLMFLLIKVTSVVGQQPAQPQAQTAQPSAVKLSLPAKNSLQKSSAKISASSDPCYTSNKPLRYFAYRKMMREHYTFTLLGSQTPVSGFKIETMKPTITLKGNILNSRSRKWLINLELTGGVQNDLMQVFSGDQLNGYFKASLGFNMLFDDGNSSKYVISKFQQTMTRKKVCEYQEVVARQIDSFLVAMAIEKIMEDTTLTLDLTISAIVKMATKDEYTIDNYNEPEKWYRPIDKNRLKEYYTTLLIEMVKNYDPTIKDSTTEAAFKNIAQKLRDKKDRSLNCDKLLKDFSRWAAFRKDRMHKYDLINSFEIESYKDIWTSKRIAWLNISGFGSNASFKMYDASAKTLAGENSFLPGVIISYNFFKKYSVANKYFYIKAGLGIRRTNSLVDLPKFDYKKETVINVAPGEELRSEKSGTAYRGLLKHGIGIEVPIEVYSAPWTQPAVPGLYGKVQYSYGEPWITKHKTSLDLGLIWNVVNAEKDSKNVLTIVPYVTWQNLLKEYEDETKTSTKKVSELFAVGVKFGIPVNLGK